MKDFKIQVICMFRNSGPVLIEALKSWTNTFERIFLVEAGRSTDNTIQLVNDFIESNNSSEIVLKFIDFEGFDISRNKCFDLAYDLDYEFSVVLDDSYKLIVQDLKDILHTFKNSEFNAFTLWIKGSNCTYRSRRVVRTSSKLRYVGKIHEQIDAVSECLTDKVIIYDIQVPEHIERTNERLNYDISCLEDTDSPRGLYQKCMMLYKLYFLGRTSYLSVIDCFNKRCIRRSTDAEEDFMANVMLGHLYVQKTELVKEGIKHYLQASLIYPPRQGECYFFIYLVTQLPFYINKAYKYRFVGEFRLPLDTRIYTNTTNTSDEVSLIELSYNQYLVQRLCQEIKSKSR